MARFALLLICGLVLASGFVYAGVQHFGALRLGYETEKLRGNLEKEREEQKRLLMQREAAASPARLEQAARQLGMQPMMPAQIDPLRQKSQPVEAEADENLAAIHAVTSPPQLGAGSKEKALKPLKLISTPIAKQNASSATVKPTSLKLQQKPKAGKPSSDQKKPR